MQSSSAIEQSQLDSRRISPVRGPIDDSNLLRPAGSGGLNGIEPGTKRLFCLNSQRKRVKLSMFSERRGGARE
jgi:hypothetical protein